MLKKNKYLRLALNTVLFAVSSFLPKAITFILTPILTRTFNTTQYGGYDKIYNICNLILPIVYIAISEAIIRYGSDKEYNKNDVFTTGIMVLAAGYTLFILLYPALRNVSTIGEFPFYIYAFVLASALRTISSHFVRALDKSILFAVDGALTSVMLMLLTVLFLYKTNLGPLAPILATICSDALSALFLLISSKSWRYFSPRNLNRRVSKEMIVYSFFMMPTAVFWWVITTSNRFVLERYLGLDAAGIYAAAARIPAFITLISAVFIQAWQMVAFSEAEDANRDGFFSAIFKSYYTVIFLAVSGIIMVIRPLIHYYLGEGFYESWQYVPFLLLGVGISCLVTFLGTIYNTAKKNLMVTITTAIGAVINIVLNFILIPLIGIQGAAIATFVGYLVVFVIRLYDTGRFMKLEIEPVRLFVNIGLLVGQIALCLTQTKYNVLLQGVVFAALLLLNIRHLIFLLTQVMEGVRRFIASRKKVHTK